MITKRRLPVVFNRTIRSTKTESDNLIHDALQFLDVSHQRGLATNVSEFNFRLALDEAVSNAVYHGNESNPGMIDKRKIHNFHGRGLCIRKNMAC